MKPTGQDYIEHLKAGTDTCLVCGDALSGGWTDYNGQIRCWKCGTTYQVLGSHHKEEWLAEVGLKKEDVAAKYCDCFNVIPILKAYWEDTGNKIPFGTYMGAPHGTGAPTRKEHDLFCTWMKNHASEYEVEYVDNFKWELIKAD